MAKSKQSACRLSNHAYAAYRSLEDGRHIQRANNLRKTEPSFGLLLLWNVIEMQLKLIRYHDRIKDGWPDKLNFIVANWTPLKRINSINKDIYKNVIGGKSSSLWRIRNQIAHTGKEIDTSKVNQYWVDALFVIERLYEHLPTREDTLAKKKRSDAQLLRTKGS
jgi:hypothetical protein